MPNYRDELNASIMSWYLRTEKFFTRRGRFHLGNVGSVKRYVYFWVDGVYFQARLEQARQCFLVIIGADEAGNKELVGLWDGFRESEQSWSELLLDLKSRGLEMGPKLATGDGALGFWTALRKVYGETRQQRCWVHKTANVLNKLPKNLQPQAKQRLHEIWMAEGRNKADRASNLVIDSYQDKNPKAAQRLARQAARQASGPGANTPRGSHWLSNQEPSVPTARTAACAESKGMLRPGNVRSGKDCSRGRLRNGARGREKLGLPD